MEINMKVLKRTFFEDVRCLWHKFVRHLIFLFLPSSSLLYRALVLVGERQEEQREIESEKSLPRDDGHAAILCLPFSS